MGKKINEQATRKKENKKWKNCKRVNFFFLLLHVLVLTDGLHDHGVHFVGAELELVARQTVGQTQRHRPHVLGAQAY